MCKICTTYLVRFQNNGGIQEPVVKNYKCYHFKLSIMSFKVHNQLYNVKSQSNTAIKAALKHC